MPIVLMTENEGQPPRSRILRQSPIVVSGTNTKEGRQGVSVSTCLLTLGSRLLLFHIGVQAGTSASFSFSTSLHVLLLPQRRAIHFSSIIKTPLGSKFHSQVGFQNPSYSYKFLSLIFSRTRKGSRKGTERNSRGVYESNLWVELGTNFSFCFQSNPFPAHSPSPKSLVLNITH